MVILPGATIGILGGGQLARMTAMAGRSLGYKIRVLDPDPRCPAAGVTDECIAASFEDAVAASRLGRGSDVVTYEIERIGPEAARAVTDAAPLRPSAGLLAMVQDRARQKAWLVDNGFPVGPYREVDDIGGALAASEALGPARLKVRSGGYDGRGQARVPSATDAAAAFVGLGSVPCVAERELDLEAELSVLVARRPSGEVAVYPPARNWHEDGILTLSQLPGELPDAVGRQARDVAEALATKLALEGLLAVELFLTTDGRLLVNELSPRPHNTFHTTETACVTSQFEQLVRAICDLPLGSTEIVRPSALANLLGDLWLRDARPAFDRPLALPGVRLSLYGKVARPGRKMGHLLASATTPAAALALVEEAMRSLTQAR
jgi:5-(carboxyamino)imidazole ribonucleotide synthase